MLEEYSDKFNNIYEAVPQGKVFRLVFDPTTRSFRLICKDNYAFDEIRKAFSVKNDSAFFSERYGFRAEEFLYAINKFGFFAPGMLFDIMQWIKDSYGTANVVAISQNCKKYIDDYLLPLKSICQKEFSISNISDDVGRNNERLREGKQQFVFRDYQEEAIKKLFFSGYGRGLIEVPTAGGKSFIIANFIWNVLKNIDRNAKTLILVPSTQLVAQFYSDLVDYGYDQRDIAKFTGGMSKKEKASNCIESAKVVIANRQYVFKNKSKLPHFDVLFADEAHTAAASSTREFIDSLDTKVKVGCSGTLPRDKYAKWQLAGMFGKTLYKVNITDLQDRGYISNVDITLLKIRSKQIDANKSLLFSLNTSIKFNADAVDAGESDVMFNDAYIAEKEYFNKWYKELYKPVFEYLSSLKSNTLMLFDRIDIGTGLYEYAKEVYVDKNVFYIDGSTKVQAREDIRSLFEKSDGNLLIAQNAVMSTGVNIKRLTNLVFLTSSKSFTRTIQSIGRTLRLHESKNRAHIIDLSWNMKYSQRHLAERLKIYKQMYGKTQHKTINVEIE